MKGHRTPRTRFAVACLTAVVAAVVAAGTAAAAPARSGKTLSIAVFSLGFANAYVQADQKGISQEAKKLGVTVKFFDGAFNARTQYNQILDAVSTGQYSGFLVMPNDGIGIVPALRRATSKNVKVVCMMLACGPDQGSIKAQIPGEVSFVGVSPVQEGINTAKMIVGACKGLNPCEVAWLPGTTSIPTDVARNAALKKELAKTSSVKLVAVQAGGFLTAPALKATQNILQAHPQVNVIATAGDQMTLGAQQAVSEAGLTGKVKLIGNAGSAQGVAAVRSGKWFGTTAWPALDEGRTALSVLVDALNGKKVPTSVDMQKKVGFTVITKANAAKYTPQWRS